MRRISYVVLFAALVAGCSSGGHGARGGSTSTTLAVLESGDSAGPHAAANALRARLLDEALLPPGARPTTAPEPIAFKGLIGIPDVGNTESTHRDFIVDEAPYEVWHWLEAHVPRRLRAAGGDVGKTNGMQMFGVNADLPVLPLNISLAELTVRVTGDKRGPSVVRVDSSVAWTPLRPEAEIVPARDGTLIASTFHPNEPGAPVGKHVVTADPKLVRPIVKAFNAARLEALPGRFAFRECGPGSMNEVEYRLEFASSPTATPDIVATLFCYEIDVTVHSRRAPTLVNLPDATWKQLRHILGIAEPTT